jgi:hypothetical protein
MLSRWRENPFRTSLCSNTVLSISNSTNRGTDQRGFQTVSPGDGIEVKDGAVKKDRLPVRHIERHGSGLLDVKGRVTVDRLGILGRYVNKRKLREYFLGLRDVFLQATDAYLDHLAHGQVQRTIGHECPPVEMCG